LIARDKDECTKQSRVIKYNTKTNEGEVLGKDQKYYSFHIGEWLSNTNIRIGETVYYEIVDDEARNIMIDKPRIKEYVIHLKIDD